MALDLELRIASSVSVNTGSGTSATSTAYDFGTEGNEGDKTPFPEGATFVVVGEDAPEAGALPVRVNLELSLDGGTNWRRVTAVTFTNAKKEIKSARFGLLDFVPEAAVIASTDRAAALNLQARCVAEYTTSAGTFTYSAFLAGPQWAPPFVE